jgi:hypothetical protein
MVLIDAAVYFEHEALFQCEIGPKTVERSGNERTSSRLIINTFNSFIGLELSKGSYYIK